MGGFNLVESMLGMTLFGAEWVLWLLVFLSVLSIAVILERAYAYHLLKINYSEMNDFLIEKLPKHDFVGIEERLKDDPSVEAKVILCGLRYREKGVRAMEGSMEGLATSEKQKLDKGLVFLGTLGNNAPFIGLFGTVIGIIKAFHDLSTNPDGGPSVVMAGISEALVATAVGLLVAIPAVIAFNVFNRIVKRHMSNVQSLIKTVMTYQG